MSSNSRCITGAEWWSILRKKKTAIMLVKLITLMGYEEFVEIDESCTAEALLNYLVRKLLTSTGPDMEKLFISKTPGNDLEIRKGFMLTDYGVKDRSTIFVFLKLEAEELRVTGVLLD